MVFRPKARGNKKQCLTRMTGNKNFILVFDKAREVGDTLAFGTITSSSEKAQWEDFGSTMPSLMNCTAEPMKSPRGRPVLEHHPVLGLRGGGADAKRKEARKRKFGNPPDSTVDAAKEDNGTERRSKKPRAQEVPDDDTKPVPLLDTEVAVVALESQTFSDGLGERTTSEKSQRFIVFIGT